MRKSNASKVINPEVSEQAAPAQGAGDVLVAYNGVQAQKITLTMRNGVKKDVVINGNNADLIGKMKGELHSGGYGLTSIPREEWEEIKKQYGKWGPIKSGLMFASDEASVDADIKAKAGLKNGYEPLQRDAISGVQERARS